LAIKVDLGMDKNPDLLLDLSRPKIGFTPQSFPNWNLKWINQENEGLNHQELGIEPVQNQLNGNSAAENGFQPTRKGWFNQS